MCCCACSSVRKKKSMLRLKNNGYLDKTTRLMTPLNNIARNTNPKTNHLFKILRYLHKLYIPDNNIICRGDPYFYWPEQIFEMPLQNKRGRYFEFQLHGLENLELMFSYGASKLTRGKYNKFFFICNHRGCISHKFMSLKRKMNKTK